MVPDRPKGMHKKTYKKNMWKNVRPATITLKNNLIFDIRMNIGLL